MVSPPAPLSHSTRSSVSNLKNYFKESSKTDSPVTIDTHGEATNVFKRATKTMTKSKTKVPEKSQPVAEARDENKSKIIASPDKRRVSPRKSTTSPAKKKAVDLTKDSSSPVGEGKSMAKAPIAVKIPNSGVKRALVLEQHQEVAKKQAVEAEEQQKSNLFAISSSTHLPPPSSETNTSQQKKSANYYNYLKTHTGPKAPGSKPIPEGAPECLSGLSFVFTGELESLSREQAQDIVKRYGGRVIGAPSSRTSYVVAGEGAGPSKMEKVKELGLTVLNEDRFLDLVRKQSSSERRTEEDATIISSSSPAKKTKRVSPAKRTKTLPKSAISIHATTSSNTHPSLLWTDKYAPTDSSELIGHHSTFQTLVKWLQEWTKPGTSFHEYKAVLLAGPPGIGKTTMAHLAAKQAGMDIYELNASDTRSKRTLHEQLAGILDNTSLLSYFSKDKKGGDALRKQVVIMDEVDGMSSGDRGGIAELILLIKRTKLPIICICNDRQSPKIRSLANYCLDLHLRRPDSRQIVPRLQRICEQEGLKVAPNALEELVVSTQSDIRQILNVLSTWSLTESSLSYDQSKDLSTGAKKDIENGPFEETGKLLGVGYNRLSLIEKFNAYFVDSGLMPLMIQENYLKCKPMQVLSSYQHSGIPYLLNSTNPSHGYLRAYYAAAESISQAIRIDSLIRGANADWSLAPFHGLMSCIRPAFFVHGAFTALSGLARLEFPSWFGFNSKSTKNFRLLREIAFHVCPKVLLTPSELRIELLPSLALIFIHMLKTNQEQRAIDLLDACTMTKEDFDALFDLVTNKECSAEAFKALPASNKAAFTRAYNKGMHKLPYMTGGEFARNVKRVIVLDDTNANMENDEMQAEEIEAETLMSDEEDEVNEKKDTEEILTKDKMIKIKKKNISSVGTNKTSSTRGGKKDGQRLAVATSSKENVRKKSVK